MKAKTIAVALAGILTGLLWTIPSFFISMITMLYILGSTKLFFLFPIIILYYIRVSDFTSLHDII